MLFARRTIYVLASMALALLASPGARAQTFSNPAFMFWDAPFVIPSPDWPYPSIINVVGGPTAITSFSITLRGVQASGGVNVMLVSPSGQKFAILRAPTGYFTSAEADLTFSAAASGSLPNPMVSGTYLPLSVRSGSMPAPAPAGPYSTNLSTLNGTNANGVWSLYTSVESPTPCRLGSGWSITFNGITTAALPTAFTYQGRLTGGPQDGTVAMRVALWDSAAGTNPANRIAGPLTYPHVAVSDHLVTQQIDFGPAIQQNKAVWMEIEIAASASGPFTLLTPRQPLTGSPLALSARGLWVDANNNVGMGTTTPAAKLHVVGSILANAYTTPSSILFKECVGPIDDALPNLLGLRPVRFDWKPEFAAQRGQTHDIGFVAEEVAAIFPEVVARDEQGRVIGMDYARLTAVAVEAIKQQQRLIDDLSARLRRLEENAGKPPIE